MAGVSRCARRDARWFDGVTVPEMSGSGQLQLTRQWRFIRDSVLEPVRASVRGDKSLLLPRSEMIRRSYNCSFRRGNVKSCTAGPARLEV